jgi:hypothetical protein
MKIGFSAAEAAAMPEGTALAWLDAYKEMHKPPSRVKKYKVLRNKGNGE